MTQEERLCKLIGDNTAILDPDTMDYIEWLVDDVLIPNGVILPPVKVGQIVYYIGGIHNSRICTATVDEIYYNGDDFAFNVVTENDVNFVVQQEEVLYTKEEAEKILEENK